jgi:hypothetical protein
MGVAEDEKARSGPAGGQDWVEIPYRVMEWRRNDQRGCGGEMLPDVHSAYPTRNKEGMAMQLANRIAIVLGALCLALLIGTFTVAVFAQDQEGGGGTKCCNINCSSCGDQSCIYENEGGECKSPYNGACCIK